MEVFSYNKSCSMVDYFRNHYKIEKLLKALGISSVASEVEDYSRMAYQRESSLCKTLVDSLKEGDILLVPDLKHLTHNVDELVEIIKDISTKKARLITLKFDSKSFNNTWDFEMLRSLLSFNQPVEEILLEDNADECIDYFDYMFSVACDYLSGYSTTSLLLKYKLYKDELSFLYEHKSSETISDEEKANRDRLLNKCRMRLKRLCLEYIGKEFLGLRFGSEQFKSKVVEVVNS